MPIPINETPSTERLHELFVYQPETGLLINKTNRSPRVKAGKAAGCIGEGYRLVRVDGTLYKAHRLIWKMAYDEDPTIDIHQGKGGSLDNRLENLSTLTRRENCSIEKTEASGLPVGVWLHKGGRYQAQINISGKNTYLGYYDTSDQASEAYQRALAMHLDGLTRQEIQKALGVAQHTPSSQYKGVYWNKARQKWVAQIQINGKKKHLGLFLTEKEASDAVLQARSASYPVITL